MELEDVAPNIFMHWLNAQENSVCFHEANPACMTWQGAEHVVLSMLINFNDTSLGEEQTVEVDLTSYDKK
ncbi:hypothetical protein LL240_01385 [Oceanimonas baumannii]|uniref:hypothetical protein n=1 Tax=Oceanimonas baumannii TaxID=129578 RepID=UPI001D197CC8|nr:hypothetical protein [Oceanimonas baumannii]MCC4263113.1 hypothetical protein [Oceanimonas baumannii]